MESHHTTAWKDQYCEQRKRNGPASKRVARQDGSRHPPFVHLAAEYGRVDGQSIFVAGRWFSCTGLSG
jgi:hypothetical protein